MYIRYERSNSQQHSGANHHDNTHNSDSNNNGSTGTGNHPPSTSSTSGGNGFGGVPLKGRIRAKKTVADLGEGLDTLHHEPSGWGELPSLKDADLDNGTEFWGVPPADLKRQQMTDRVRTCHQPGALMSKHHTSGQWITCGRKSRTSLN